MIQPAAIFGSRRVPLARPAITARTPARARDLTESQTYITSTTLMSDPEFNHALILTESRFSDLFSYFFILRIFQCREQLQHCAISIDMIR